MLKMPSTLLSIFVGLLAINIFGQSEAQNCKLHHDNVGDGETEVLIHVRDATQLDSDGFFKVDFLEGQFANLTDVKTWCVDVNRSIDAGFEYRADTFSSLAEPDQFNDYGAVDKPNMLPALNYLINVHPVGTWVEVESCGRNKVTDHDFQVAVWTLIDASPYPHLLLEGETKCVVDFLVNEGQNNMLYEPDCDDPNAKLGLLQIVDDWFGQILYQVILSELLLKDTGACICAEEYNGGGAKNQTGGVNGDPHFKTWSGEKYDFHGVCDLVLLTNPSFRDDIGMDIHVRSKQWKQWSYISTAVIRIGVELFEVAGHSDGGTFWINGVQGDDENDWLKDEENQPSLAGYPITHRMPHRFQREYTIKLRTKEYIVIKVWKDFVRVDVQGPRAEDFLGSAGLIGSFPEGTKLGRDGKTILEDNNKYGQEWQVLASDKFLFHTREGPQHPSHCELPTKTALRRKLAKSKISRQEAELACSRVTEDERDLCIFDVMTTDDRDLAGAY